MSFVAFAGTMWLFILLHVMAPNSVFFLLSWPAETLQKSKSESCGCPFPLAFPVLTLLKAQSFNFYTYKRILCLLFLLIHAEQVG